MKQHKLKKYLTEQKDIQGLHISDIDLMICTMSSETYNIASNEQKHTVLNVTGMFKSFRTSMFNYRTKTLNKTALCLCSDLMFDYLKSKLIKKAISKKPILKVAINRILKTEGIYFLYQGHNLVYVGASLNLHGRLKNHNHSFDKVAYLTPKDYAFFGKTFKVEKILIRELRPELNIVGKPNCTPELF